MTRHRRRHHPAWLVVVPLLTFGVIAAAAQPSRSSDRHPTSSGGPPGNNGTVKVDGVPFDVLPDNEPHVGCTLQIDFYGYDEGNLSASYDFQLWAPTGSGTLRAGSVFIGEDAAGGGTDLDASVTVDLASELQASGVAPQPNQGHHVRLTVHAQGSIGADVKHKMFWVRCGIPSTTTPPASTTTPPASTTTPPASTTTPPASTTTPPATVSGTTVTTPPPTGTTHTPPATTSSTVPPTVQGSTFTPPGGGGGQSPSGLAFTGSETVWAALAALVLLLAGTGSLWLSRRLGRPEGDRSSS